MPNKYIIHGAAFNGDGTTSAEASSAGAAGAWNNIWVFTGTAVGFGTLLAGDTVYIRSKTSAGADIVFSSATAYSVGSAAATALNPVTWVVDHGVIWPGISGQVTCVLTNGQQAITLRNFNVFNAYQYNLHIINTAATGPFDNIQIALQDIKTYQVKFSTSTASNYQGGRLAVTGGIHVDGWFVCALKQSMFFQFERGPTTKFINPQIELLTANTAPVFFVGSYQSFRFVEVYGGRVFGPGATDNVPIVNSTWEYGVMVSFFGFEYPVTMPMVQLPAADVAGFVSSLSADGVFGNTYIDRSCAYDSRSDAYYPTLSARLNLSTSPSWSYKLTPYRASRHAPALVTLSKTYTQVAAQKTVTLEILWPSSSGMGSPDSSFVYMVVQYRNSAGVKVSENTRTDAVVSLMDSTANWTTQTYGAVLLTRKKIVLQTAHAVKQDSEILVSFFVEKPTTSNITDLIFIDPDPSLS